MHLTNWITAIHKSVFFITFRIASCLSLREIYIQDELHLWMDDCSCRRDGFTCTRYEHAYSNVLLLHRGCEISSNILHMLCQDQ